MRAFRLILVVSASALLLDCSDAWAQQTLYGASNGVGILYTIDPNTGVGTPVGPILEGATSLSISGLAFDPLNGVLYGATRLGSLVTIDPSTGAATTIGPSGAGGIGFGISFRSDGTLFAL